MRSAKTVFFGMAIAQAIPILGSLIISRLYLPSDFGTFSVWLGMVQTAAVILTCRFETALAVEPDGEPREFAVKATIATTILTTIAFAPFAITYTVLFEFQTYFSIGLVILAIAASMLLAVVQIWQSWAAAEGSYKKLSWIRISQAVSVIGSQIIAGWIAPSAIWLAIGQSVGMLISVIIAFWLMPINFASMRRLDEFRIELISFVKAHHRFPQFALPADLINSVSGQLPLLIIAGKFGAEASGLFALTVRVLGAPIGLLGVAILDVFKRVAASSFRSKGNCRVEYINTFKILIVAACLLTLGVILTAELIFVAAYGEAWRNSGAIAIWLMPMFALRLVASPLSYVFYIAGKQQIDLIWQCALMVMTVLTFALSSTFQSSIENYAYGYASLYVIYISLSYYYSSLVTNATSNTSV